MYLMYVDESGDTGMGGSPTRYFVLTGLVVHELRWNDNLERLYEFRQRMRDSHGLKLREEFHAAAFIARPGGLKRIPRNDRLAMIRGFASVLAALPTITLINIVVDKQNKAPDYDVFENAWRALIQRFENTLTRRNFPDPSNTEDTGILLPDNTDNLKLTRLLRKMHRFNPVPNQSEFGAGYRDLRVTNIVEDPCFRDSRKSLYVQAADLACFLLYQSLAPSTYMRKKGGHRYFERLAPILCRVASRTDPLGIVRL